MLKLTKRLLPAVAGVAAVALLATGCGASANKNAPGSSDRLVIDWAAGNTTLDPAGACSGDDLSLIHNLYSTLTKYDTVEGPEGTTQYDPTKIVPSFAKSWEVSPDGKTYTFALTEGAKFSDGSPMDAAAVKFSAERVLASGTCAGFYLQAGEVAPPLIEKIEAPDAATVVFQLARPNADFLAGLATPAGSIVNPKVIAANGGDKEGTPNEYMASHVAGGGPYLLDSYSPSSKAILKANPTYFGTAPKTSEIEINYVTAPSTLLLKAKSQGTDVTLGMPPQSIDSLKSEDCCRVVSYSAPTGITVALKYDAAPTNNVKFREALALAIPYEDLLKNVAYDNGSLFYGPVVPAAAGADVAGSDPLVTDVEAAKALIAESGVKTPVDLDMLVNASSPISVQLATAVQGAWKELGVNLQVKSLAPSEFTPTYTTGDFTTAINIEGPGVPTAGYQLTLTTKCDSPFNNAHVCVPGVDEKLARARVTSDTAEANSLYSEITSLWREQFPRIWLYSPDSLVVLGKRVDSFQYAKFLDFSTWSVTE